MLRNLPKQLEVSLGILVGYLIMASINVLFWGTPVKKAFWDPTILALTAGVILAYLLFIRNKSNNGDETSE
ncbi:MAG: hypothetical protein AAF798_01260 [Bacteroidota bacterium]